MANKKISELPKATELSGQEEFVFALGGTNGTATTDKIKEYVAPNTSDFVTTNGAQTISGQKTFEKPIQTKYNEGIIDAKEALFIDQWTAACGSYGQYNAQTGLFELNGLTDITYENALLIYQFSHTSPVNNLEKLYYACLNQYSLRAKLRTLLPIKCRYNENNLDYSFVNCMYLQVISFLPANNTILVLAAGHINSAFYGCTELRSILTPIKMPYVSDVVSAFTGCFALEHVELSVRGSVNIQDSPLLSLHSVQYLVANATNTSEITITVHSDVYAKLNDETNTEWNQVLVDAEAKNIVFATV